MTDFDPHMFTYGPSAQDALKATKTGEHATAGQEMPEPKLEDFMVRSVEAGKVLVSGAKTPTTLMKQGEAPIGEQIAKALEDGDIDAARQIHEQNPIV